MQWDVEVTGTGGSYIGRAPNKLAGLYTLIFRRSSCQHPLMAGALGSIPTPSFVCLICFFNPLPILAASIDFFTAWPLESLY